jgi:hypothetical protein
MRTRRKPRFHYSFSGSSRCFPIASRSGFQNLLLVNIAGRWREARPRRLPLRAEHVSSLEPAKNWRRNHAISPADRRSLAPTGSVCQRDLPILAYMDRRRWRFSGHRVRRDLSGRAHARPLLTIWSRSRRHSQPARTPRYCPPCSGTPSDGKKISR